MTYPRCSDVLSYLPSYQRLQPLLEHNLLQSHPWFSLLVGADWFAQARSLANAAQRQGISTFDAIYRDPYLPGRLKSPVFVGKVNIPLNPPKKRGF